MLYTVMLFFFLVLKIAVHIRFSKEQADSLANLGFLIYLTGRKDMLLSLSFFYPKIFNGNRREAT